MYPRNSYWKLDIWKEDYQKFSEKLTSFFIEFAMRSKKKQELIHSPFWGCQICFFYFAAHHLTSFDTLIQRGFGVSPRIAIGNLCKSFLDAAIVPFSTFPWNHNTFNKKEKNFKNVNIWRKKRALYLK